MFRPAGGAAVWRPAVEPLRVSLSRRERGHAEAARSRPSYYGNSESEKYRKRPIPAPLSPLSTTSIWRSPTRSLSCWSAPPAAASPPPCAWSPVWRRSPSGELYIGDKLMNDVEPKDRDIAMVFQSYALYPHMTVYENMAFALKLRKMPKDEIDKRVQGGRRRSWTSPSIWSASPRPCPAASASVWPSAAPSSASPRCS